jgi:hypothetical protein
MSRKFIHFTCKNSQPLPPTMCTLGGCRNGAESGYPITRQLVTRFGVNDLACLERRVERYPPWADATVIMRKRPSKEGSTANQPFCLITLPPSPYHRFWLRLTGYEEHNSGRSPRACRMVAKSQAFPARFQSLLPILHHAGAIRSLERETETYHPFTHLRTVPGCSAGRFN